ncbi:uncharacterized protein LOC107269376 isoform X2 [Cephus cinctus]|uniref:Uncharacterized protein LOC107269376 isoform X2 n=1 Tax=Cephus cinctus TaxID=211228 RepID=A0AAJ7C003_CEPCN|nr:uncharacterized protein LOC107269376 isoform X2 [Cephus cinctus]
MHFVCYTYPLCNIVAALAGLKVGTSEGNGCPGVYLDTCRKFSAMDPGKIDTVGDNLDFTRLSQHVPSTGGFTLNLCALQPCYRISHYWRLYSSLQATCEYESGIAQWSRTNHWIKSIFNKNSPQHWKQRLSSCWEDSSHGGPTPIK